MSVRLFLATTILWVIATVSALAGQPAVSADHPAPIVTSLAFADGGKIPVRYTCAGADVSPPLAWRGIPEEARTLALVVDDPDAPSGTFTHWIVYNIDRESRGLPENLANAAKSNLEYPQAVNDFAHPGYNGPCPPPGKPHHYHFKLYALAASLDLQPGATAKQFDVAVRGKILAMGEMIATFER